MSAYQTALTYDEGVRRLIGEPAVRLTRLNSAAASLRRRTRM